MQTNVMQIPLYAGYAGPKVQETDPVTRNRICCLRRII